MSWPIWAGDIPTWITTAAVGFAGAQLLVDRRRRAAEENREAKAQASKLSAWAVSDRNAVPLAFGVVVSNRSVSTFHNVSIVAKIHKKQIASEIHFEVLPPGEFFVELANGEWEFAVEANEHGRMLRPYTRTEGYRVLSIGFTDNLDQRWSADAHMVLRRAG
ncbi:hypothetical protein KNO15_04780 [Leifsonia shinshuensis]|uniref:hypothetical protein n=1 Tax=Leifsonia shinshuensis TaxID=150026 RepID=UPI001F50E633|nr:hypothetical protein [Leifsonia shinshuensis]MCI0156008.1 hypothetical protein [Leifsonia shinshuensis]